MRRESHWPVPVSVMLTAVVMAILLSPQKALAQCGDLCSSCYPYMQKQGWVFCGPCHGSYDTACTVGSSCPSCEDGLASSDAPSAAVIADGLRAAVGSAVGLAGFIAAHRGRLVVNVQRSIVAIQSTGCSANANELGSLTAMVRLRPEQLTAIMRLGVMSMEDYYKKARQVAT